MNQDFKQALQFLYEQFGDQGIAWVKGQVAARGGGHPAPADDGADPDDERPGSSGAGKSANGDDGAFAADPSAAGIGASMQGLAVRGITSPEQVVVAVTGLVRMAGEVRRFEEAEVTKRVGMAADRDIAIANIKAQQEVLQNYLNRSFDERAQNFDKLFTVVDDALETNNMQALAMGLESVVKLAASSPFKDLRNVEETAAALADPDHEWDF